MLPISIVRALEAAALVSWSSCRSLEHFSSPTGCSFSLLSRRLGTFSVAHRLHPRPLRDAGLWELCSGLRVDCVFYAFFCFPPHPTPSRASAPSSGPRFRSYIRSRFGVGLRLTPSSVSVPHLVLLRSPWSLRPKLGGGGCSGPTDLAGRYCHNSDSRIRKRSPSVCLVWISPLLKQPGKSFDSVILYGRDFDSVQII